MERNKKTETLSEIVRVVKLLSLQSIKNYDWNLFTQRLFGTSIIGTIKNSYFVELMSGVPNDYVLKCKDSFCQKCALQKWCVYWKDKVQNETDPKAPKYVDLFCGAGGLSLGFEQESYVLSLANDIDDSCIETYAFNHFDTPEKHIIKGDINKVLSRIDEAMRFDKNDIVIGGPPCQGFSMANRQRIIDDPRNHLYKSFIAAVKIINPKFVLMENVRGMLGVQDQIKEDLKTIGFDVEAKILNARDFGVPQNRERVIFIGNRIGIDNAKVFQDIMQLAESTNEVVLSDALYGLPELKAKTIPHNTSIEGEETGYTIASNSHLTNNYLSLINDNRDIPLLFNHKARYNNERDIKIFDLLKPGEDSTTDRIQEIMPYKRRAGIFKDKYYKLDETKICKTIAAHMKYDCNMYIHPTQARGLTPREAARIQSYPDDYLFRGPYTKTYMQVGNSVPPLMGRYIARVIKKYL